MARHHMPSKISRASFARIFSPCACGPRCPFGAVWRNQTLAFPDGVYTPYSSAREPHVGDSRLSDKHAVNCVSRQRFQLGSGETSPQSIDLYRQISTYAGGGMVFSGPPAPRSNVLAPPGSYCSVNDEFIGRLLSHYRVAPRRRRSGKRKVGSHRAATRGTSGDQRQGNAEKWSPHTITRPQR